MLCNCVTHRLVCRLSSSKRKFQLMAAILISPTSKYSQSDPERLSLLYLIKSKMIHKEIKQRLKRKTSNETSITVKSSLLLRVKFQKYLELFQSQRIPLMLLSSSLCKWGESVRPFWQKYNLQLTINQFNY